MRLTVLACVSTLLLAACGGASTRAETTTEVLTLDERDDADLSEDRD
jgi:hypothetical protein